MRYSFRPASRRTPVVLRHLTLASPASLALMISPLAVRAAAAPEVKLAIGGAGCLCYLPTVLAHQLGLYKKNGVNVEMIAFKGGSQALTAVIGGSVNVVSGYYDHTIDLSAKGKPFQAFTSTTASRAWCWWWRRKTPIRLRRSVIWPTSVLASVRRAHPPTSF